MPCDRTGARYNLDARFTNCSRQLRRVREISRTFDPWLSRSSGQSITPILGSLDIRGVANLATASGVIGLFTYSARPSVLNPLEHSTARVGAPTG